VEEQTIETTLTVNLTGTTYEHKPVSLMRSQFGDKVVTWRDNLAPYNASIAWTPFLLSVAVKAIDFPISRITIELHQTLATLTKQRWWNSDAQYCNTLLNHLIEYLDKHRKLCEEYFGV